VSGWGWVMVGMPIVALWAVALWARKLQGYLNKVVDVLNTLIAASERMAQIVEESDHPDAQDALVQYTLVGNEALLQVEKLMEKPK
jgi:hypothetical protein